MEKKVPADSSDQGYYRFLCAVLPEAELKVTDLALMKQLLNSFISELVPADQQIVRERFGLTGTVKTLQQIGDALGVTRERIRQLERRALRRLKHPTRAIKLRQYVEVT